MELSIQRAVSAIVSKYIFQMKGVSSGNIRLYNNKRKQKKI